MKLSDKKTGEIITNQVRVAKHFIARMRGLIGTNELGPNTCFWIPKCQGVHTFGMRYTIDVIFLDREERILHVEKDLEPNCRGPVLWEASSVIELESRFAVYHRFWPGRQLCFSE